MFERRNMYTKEQLLLSERYIDCIFNIYSLNLHGLYGIEQQRIELHNALCDILGIDHIESKSITSFLDKIFPDLFIYNNDGTFSTKKDFLCNEELRKASIILLDKLTDKMVKNE